MSMEKGRRGRKQKNTRCRRVWERKERVEQTGDIKGTKKKSHRERVKDNRNSLTIVLEITCEFCKCDVDLRDEQ